MNQKFELFIDHVKECKQTCVQELAERKAGIPGESTIEQLETIISEMDRLLRSLTVDTIPPGEKRFLISFACAFKEWCWDMRKPTRLYSQLVALHNEYEGLKED